MHQLLKTSIFILVVVGVMMATHTEAAKPTPNTVLDAQSAAPMIVYFTATQYSCLSSHVCAEYHWETANAVRVRIRSGYIDSTTGKFVDSTNPAFRRRVAPTGMIFNI